ncbi:hypothetical protein MRX96_019612 [Rhipicephalus microplus]
MSVGTVRVDRTEKCPLAPDATLKAQGRGSVDFRVDEDSNIGVIKCTARKKNRCKFCKFGYTFLYCAKCNMHLCLLPSHNCFKAFHVR